MLPIWEEIKQILLTTTCPMDEEVLFFVINDWSNLSHGWGSFVFPLSMIEVTCHHNFIKFLLLVEFPSTSLILFVFPYYFHSRRRKWNVKWITWNPLRSWKRSGCLITKSIQPMAVLAVHIPKRLAWVWTTSTS